MHSHHRFFYFLPILTMTRANLNFIYQSIGETPRSLFHYHNGDQYPAGLLCFYGIEPFLTLDHPWTADDFRAWIATNYRKAGRAIATLPNGMKIDRYGESDEPAEPQDLGEGGQPRIHFTDGFLTDYSYVFKSGSDGHRPDNQVTAWEWDELIFSGTAREFLAYCKAETKESNLVPLPHKSEQAIFDSMLAVVAGGRPPGTAPLPKAA